MTVTFNRLDGTLPCNDPIPLKTPEKNRMAYIIDMSPGRWATFGRYLSAANHDFPPGSKARIFSRLGWPREDA